MQMFPYIILVTCPNHIAKSFLEITVLQGTKGEGLNTEHGNRWEKQVWNMEESSRKI